MTRSRDLVPISMMTDNGMAFAVNKDLPVHSMREFIDYARANPGKINYGATGLGASSHLAPAAFAAREKLDMVVVPYTATPPSIMALLNGTIQVFFGNIADIMGTAQGGGARILAFSTDKAAAAIPGHSDRCGDNAWFRLHQLDGLFRASRDAAPDRRPVGAERSRTVSRDPEVVKLLGDLSVETIGCTPEELAAAIQRDLPIYRSRGGGRGPDAAVARACS